jgi:hypothetical protein
MCHYHILDFVEGAFVAILLENKGKYANCAAKEKELFVGNHPQHLQFKIT